MSRLIVELLDVSRISRGKILLLREPLDLDKLASTILWVLGRAASSAGP